LQIVAQPQDAPTSNQLNQAVASAPLTPPAVAGDSSHGTAHQQQQYPEQQELEAASDEEGEATSSATATGCVAGEEEAPGDPLSRVLVRGNSSLMKEMLRYAAISFPKFLAISIVKIGCFGLLRGVVFQKTLLSSRVASLLSYHPSITPSIRQACILKSAAYSDLLHLASQYSLPQLEDSC
jgi:hypothetical protein